MQRPLILIADDNADSRIIIRLALEHRGYEVTTAVDGRDAVEQARQHSPDLILMDLQMPRVDGYGAVRELKADPATAHIPVLAVTAIDAGTELRKHGFCGILLKPITPTELGRAVELCREQTANGKEWVHMSGFSAPAQPQ